MARRTRHIQQFDGLDLRDDLAAAQAEDAAIRQQTDGLNEFLWNNERIKRPDADMLEEPEISVEPPVVKRGGAVQMAGLDLRPDLAEEKANFDLQTGLNEFLWAQNDGIPRPDADMLPKVDVAKSSRQVAADRTPLVSKPSAIPPEVEAFVKAKVAGDGPQMPTVNKGAKVLDLIDSAGGDFAAAADMYSGRQGPRIDRSKQGQFADQLRSEDAARDEAVKRFALEKMARTDKDAARALEQMRYDTEQKRLAAKDKAAAEEHAADLKYKGALTTQAEATAQKMGRAGTGKKPVDPLRQEKLKLEVEKLRSDLKKGDGVDEKDIETLSKRLEGLPGQKNDLATLVKYAEMKSIPGVGPVAGRVPDWIASDEAVRLRQSAKGVLGQLIKEQSGTAASEPEVERKLDELGMGPGASEAKFRSGLERLLNNVRANAKSKEAIAKEPTIQEARRRGLVTSEDLPHYSADGGAPAPAREKTVNGVRYVHDGKGWKRAN